MGFVASSARLLAQVMTSADNGMIPTSRAVVSGSPGCPRPIRAS
jgi:hypothetical protein